MRNNFTLERDAWQRLVLVDTNGARYEGVEPVRAFPVSDPQRAISIVDSDGREVIFIQTLDDVPEAARVELEKELAEREFLPIIVRILNKPADTEPSDWQVETDRGVTTFQLESAEHVHRMAGNAFSIVDAQGIRYRIPNAVKLDHHSRHVMARFL